MDWDLSTFDAFCYVIAKLRSQDGCPWDQAQTHESLKPYLIEEAYETLQALDDGDMEKLCEELGDLLLQIGLHAQIGKESGEFEMADILRCINEKLIRRHPHVFGDAEVSSADEVILNWEEIKRSEGTIKNSLLDGIPKNIPSLAYSQIMQQRAARVGFDWNEIEDVLDKVSEELSEIKQAQTHQERVREFGDLLMALANTARWMEIDLESALGQANERFRDRFALMENISRKRGIPMQSLTMEELDTLWEEAKEALLGDQGGNDAHY